MVCKKCGSQAVHDHNHDPVVTPDIMLRAVILRRKAPKDWLKAPPTFTNFKDLYDLLAVRVNDPGARELVYKLPETRSLNGLDPAEDIKTAWPSVRFKRPIFIDAVCTPASPVVNLVYCLPVCSMNEDGDGTGVDLQRFHDAAWVPLHEALHIRHGLEIPMVSFLEDSRAILASFHNWLEHTHRSPLNIASYWATPAHKRLVNVVRNETFGMIVHQNKNNVVQNPLFNTDLLLQPPAELTESSRYADDFETRDLQAPSDSEIFRTKSAAIVLSARWNDNIDFRPVPSWSDKHPVHRACVVGDAETLRHLVSTHSPSETDDDSWTPLHYASWFGHEGCVNVLMEDWQGLPSKKTDNGSTALHLAAHNGHLAIVKILVACPIVDPSALDNDKRTPLMLCERAQLNSFDEVAQILRDPAGLSAVNRLVPRNEEDVAEHHVYLVDGTVKLLHLPGGDSTTARELRDAMAGLFGLPLDAAPLFSIWIQSSHLQLQFEDEMKPLRRLKIFPKLIEMYCEAEDQEEEPCVYFRRDCIIALADERRTKSSVALKLLFDEALHYVMKSIYPIDVDGAIYLAGVLMQLKHGDAKKDEQRVGALKDALHTLVPPHLLHNQLKTSEWEKKIFDAHTSHRGKTDPVLLHRLYLQYCRQWPYYGAVFFDGYLARSFKQLIKPQKTDALQVAVSRDFVCFLVSNQMKAAIPLDEVTSHYDQSNLLISLTYIGPDSSKLAGLAFAGKSNSGETVLIHSKQALLIELLINKMKYLNNILKEDLEKKRLQQGGPKVMPRVSIAGEDHLRRTAAPEDPRMAKEKAARYHLIHSFGQASLQDKSHAQHLFERSSRDGNGLVSIKDLKYVCFELGYWLGGELEGARMILDASGSGFFNFRDLVSWWTQSSRSWLLLLDDEAFKLRRAATEVFLRNDSHRTGKLADEKQINGVVKGLRADGITKKSEPAILEGLDPEKTGVISFNAYIDWLSFMDLIADKHGAFS